MPAPSVGHRAGGRARAGSRAAVAVAAVAFAGGIGAGAVVQPLDASSVGTSAAAADHTGAGASAAGRSTTRGDAPGGARGATDGAADDAASTAVADGATSAGAAQPPAGAGGSTAALDAAVADVRPIPVPELVERDAAGPMWLTPADRAAGLLALDVPRAASGVLDAVPGTTPAPGVVGVRTVRVEVERGLPVDGAAFAATVMDTLNDPRGWGAGGDLSFARTDGPAELRVVLASPDLVDALCAPLETVGEVSCGRNGHAVLNHKRWVLATDEFPDRTQYRHYLVNHEVGHLLGHGHEECPAPGRLAPLMQQQSLGVAPCVPNGWPSP